MKIVFEKIPKDEVLEFEYQFYKTNIGNLLIVSWEKSLVYIAFVNSQTEALEEAKARFPKARFVKKESAPHKTILSYLKAPKKFNKTLTLATSARPFQIQVWQALLKIPYGNTCFYSDLAKAVGNPAAVRAAASAVARNPLAILIPCHRVLPRSGGIGNYHWGSKHKSTLLTWESLTLAK